MHWMGSQYSASQKIFWSQRGQMNTDFIIIFYYYIIIIITDKGPEGH